MKTNKKRSVALESTREWQIDSTGRLLFEQGVARRRYDTDDFNRLVLLPFFVQIRAPASVGASAALNRWGICSRILNSLSKRVAVRVTDVDGLAAETALSSRPDREAPQSHAPTHF